MKAKRLFDIRISAKFGTSNQKSVAITELFTLLNAWEKFFNSQHEKNNISFEIRNQNA